MIKWQAGVIGSPISHSLSPQIFKFIANHLNTSEQLEYQAIEVRTGLANFLAKIENSTNWVGLNVTIPHKETVLKFASRWTSEVKATLAANVLKIDRSREKPEFEAHNTDVQGILDTLHEQNLKIRNHTAWLIGAGGAARAAAFALGREGASRVYISNPRSPERAEALAKDLGAVLPGTVFTSVAFGLPFAAAPEPIQLVIQCTPIGQSGIGDPEFYAPLDDFKFAKDALAFEMIYRPERTFFLNRAQALGLRTVGGLDMLISQALASWEIWFGALSEKIELKKRLRTHLENVLAADRPIFLTGFMGAGKTVVGQILAQKLGWNFLDTDQAIEREAAQTVSEIFRAHGEAFFRELEKKLIKKAASTQKTVIALGGGTLLADENRTIALTQGRLVYLHAKMDTLQKRLGEQSTSRPLLQPWVTLSSQTPAQVLITLLSERSPAYDQAELKIETDLLTPEEVANEIAKKIVDKKSP
jgi:shikimate dehydrogenase